MKESQGTTVYLKDYRAPDFLIHETHLLVQLHEDHALVTARLRVRRNPAAADAGAALELAGRQLELVSVALDRRMLGAGAFHTDSEKLVIPEVPEQFELECVTRIRPQDNTSLEGLYKSRVMFCTQCEAEGFRKITYYLDRPDVLSSFTTRIEAECRRYPVLLSNGNLLEQGELPEERHFATWHDPFLKPCYLFALVAGDLKAVDDRFKTRNGRDVQLRIFVEQKDLDKCEFAMGALKRAMRWDEEVYGREYDLDIFMIVAVDDFNMGAMENKGLNIFNSSCVLANPAVTTDAAFQRIESIVAHEYFHNWSGNRVTCRDWFQLSLKEGFTVFRDAEFSADMGSRAVNRIEDVSFLRTVQFAEDSGPMAHPVRPDSYMEISNFYTVTIYEKGSEVVRMIASLLGPELFRRGTDRYFTRFDGMAVTTEDFVQVMEEVSGMDLTQFRRWYTQAGTPQLEVGRSYDAARKEFTLTFRQSCPPTPRQPVKEPFFIPVAAALLNSKGQELPMRFAGENAILTSRVLQVTEAEQRFTFVNVQEAPVPSLLRGFSAPVKLKVDYSREELMFLMSHDSDGFVRWDAAQQFALQVIQECMDQRRLGQPFQMDQRLVIAWEHILRSCLDDPAVDKAMVANLLLLPSEAYLSELMSEVDPDAIHDVREQVRRQLARQLRLLFGEVYQANGSPAPYEYSAGEVARRSLRNTVLNYLLTLDDPAWQHQAWLQFAGATNMTDESAALRGLVNNPTAASASLRDELLETFYQKWKHETLVVEQWLALQSAAPGRNNLSRVKALLQHEAFDIRNPNKVRSVIGAYCNSNLVGFHALDGEGYRFLADHVLILNRSNPQIASRQLTPLTRWRKYGPARQALMKTQLQRILSEPDLSADVFEVVSKSLQDEVSRPVQNQ